MHIQGCCYLLIATDSCAMMPCTEASPRMVEFNNDFQSDAVICSPPPTTGRMSLQEAPTLAIFLLEEVLGVVFKIGLAQGLH